GDGRPHQVGTGPVVELAVRDSDDLRGAGPAVPLLLVHVALLSVTDDRAVVTAVSGLPLYGPGAEVVNGRDQDQETKLSRRRARGPRRDRVERRATRARCGTGRG